MAEGLALNLFQNIPPVAQPDIKKALHDGERVIGIEELTDTTTLYKVGRRGLYPGDGVLLRLTGLSDPDVLLGGKPLTLTAEVGMVTVHIVNLNRGIHEATRLFGRQDQTSPTNQNQPKHSMVINPEFDGPVAYWCEPDVTLGSCVVRDECRGFDQGKEVTATAVLSAISNSLIYP